MCARLRRLFLCGAADCAIGGNNVTIFKVLAVARGTFKALRFEMQCAFIQELTIFPWSFQKIPKHRARNMYYYYNFNCFISICIG